MKASAWDAEPANIAPSKHTAAGTEGADLRPEPLEPLELLLERLELLLPLFEPLELDFDPFRPFFSLLSFFPSSLLGAACACTGSRCRGSRGALVEKLALIPTIAKPLLKELAFLLAFPFTPRAWGF